jgi:hypothetical protein
MQYHFKCTSDAAARPVSSRVSFQHRIGRARPQKLESKPLLDFELGPSRTGLAGQLGAYQPGPVPPYFPLGCVAAYSSGKLRSANWGASSASKASTVPEFRSATQGRRASSRSLRANPRQPTVAQHRHDEALFFAPGRRSVVSLGPSYSHFDKSVSLCAARRRRRGR